MTETGLIFLIIPAFFVCFGLFWSLIVFLIAHIGGWAGLARAYPATLPPQGRSWTWTSAKFGLVANYRNCVNVTVSNTGIDLRPVIFFRIGHKPMLIPWHAIAEARRSDLYFTSALRLEIKDGSDGAKRITLYGKPLVNELEDQLRHNRVAVS
jgi:hypothetical protein